MTPHHLRISAFLPSMVNSLLLTQPVDNWIKVLKKCEKGNDYLVHLFQAIVKVPNWNKDKTSKLLAKTLDKTIKSKSLTKCANKLFNEAHKIFKKESSLKKATDTKNTEKDNVKESNSTSKSSATTQTLENDTPTQGIPNIGNFCYMATVLQHLRHTNTFESILSGPIHDFTSEAERLSLTDLQSCLRSVVDDLRDPNINCVSTEKLTALVKKMTACRIINQAGSQHDGTEVLSRLITYMGAAPEAVRLDQQVCYNDGSTIYRDRIEMSDYFPLQTSQECQTTSQLLAVYFGQTVGRTVRFDVVVQGRTIAQLDGGTGRVAARRALGNQAVTEEGLLAEQIVFIKEQHKAAHGDVQVNVVPVRYTQNQLASLPGTIQMRINSVGGKAIVEERVCLAAHLRNALGAGESATYELDAVMCRSGKLSNPQSKDPSERDTAGHFWYYKKENGSWTRYSDLNITKPTAVEIAHEFHESGYACFYNKV